MGLAQCSWTSWDQEGLKAQGAGTSRGSHGKHWLVSAPPTPRLALRLFLLGQMPPGPPACPSTYKSSVGHWGPLRDFLGPERELGKLARKLPESGVLAPSAHWGPLTYPEVQIVFDIPEEAPHHCSKMDDTCGPDFFKQRSGLCSVPEGEPGHQGLLGGPRELAPWLKALAGRSQAGPKVGGAAKRESVPGQALAGMRVWAYRKRWEEVCPGAKPHTPRPGQPPGRDGPHMRLPGPGTGLAQSSQSREGMVGLLQG